MVKSYLSAIKAVLMEIGVRLSEDNYLLTSLTRACKLKNDQIIMKLPITKDVLKLIINAVTKLYAVQKSQPYLLCLFKVVYTAAYFGLLRIGEIAKSEHAILARNVHIGTNKNKILFILETSKTHG